MPDLTSKLQSAPRRMARAARSRLHGTPPPLPTDAELAAQYDRARGYDRPRAERAQEARRDVADAPPVTWTPPVRRQHV